MTDAPSPRADREAIARVIKRKLREWRQPQANTEARDEPLMLADLFLALGILHPSREEDEVVYTEAEKQHDADMAEASERGHFPEAPEDADVTIPGSLFRDMHAAYGADRSRPPLSAIAEAERALEEWTPELEAARIKLCQDMVERADVYGGPLGRLLLDGEMALTLLGDIIARASTALRAIPAPFQPNGRTTMTEDQIKHMVNRFLSWRLPDDFRPDCGIKFDADEYVKLNPRNRRLEPVGTNLLSATQATAMVRHMIEGLVIPAMTGAADPRNREEAPGHTDLMVTPESIDAFMEANPLPSDADRASIMLETCAIRLGARVDVAPANGSVTIGVGFAVEIIEAMRTALSAVVAIPTPSQPNGWRDIGTAPKDGTWVIVYLASWQIPPSKMSIVRWITTVEGEGWHDEEEEDGPIMSPVTHWQPLPTQPKADEPS